MNAAGAAPSLVAATRLSKTFRNGVAALDQIDLAVPRGAFLSLLGPSGCGKSTLLRLIAGLTPPSAGAITWPSGQGARIGRADRKSVV